MEKFARVLRLWPWLAAAASGFVYAGCFAPFDHPSLCWIALTPLIAAIWFSGENSKRRWLRDLTLGYVAGLAFFWTVFFWLRTVTVPGVVLVGFYMAIYFASWSWLCGFLRPRIERGAPSDRSPWLHSLHNLRLAFLLAAAWVTHEWLRSIVFSGWGWNTLGSALHGQFALIQIVEWTGVPGLSFLVAFCNVIAVTSVRRFMLETHVRPMRAHYDLTLTMIAVVSVMAYGIHALQIRRPAKPIRIAAVQANIPREHKFNREWMSSIFDQFNRLSDVALHSQPPIDLLMWPESSMPGPMFEEEESYRFVTDFSARTKVDLLLGTIEQDETGAYNAARLVSDGGKGMQIYRKMHLVPFGEYVPGRHTIPFISQVVGDQVPDDFAFGREHTVFRLTSSDVLVAPLICFEDTIGDLTRQFVRGGATLLANVTNDGWFQRSAGSQQHLANAVFRCVETRRPMARAANTGVTCFINEFGRVTQILLDESGSQFTEGVLTGSVTVPTDPEFTFYVRHGELFAHGCVAATSATLLFLFLRSLRRRQ